MNSSTKAIVISGRLGLVADLVLDASVAISRCFPDDPSENTPFSRRILGRLATDDAAYLNIALREELPLATSDEDLSKAALAEGVPVL